MTRHWKHTDAGLMVPCSVIDPLENAVRRAEQRALGALFGEAEPQRPARVFAKPIVESDPWRRRVREFHARHPGNLLGFMPPIHLTRLGKTRIRLLRLLGQRAEQADLLTSG